MMLTLRRIFLGLNGIAINGKRLTIQVLPEKNNRGDIIGTKWLLSGATFSDESCIKDYLAGIHIDEPENDVSMSFYDKTGKYTRFIADRVSNTPGIRRSKTKKSAFKMMLEILQECVDDIDDTVLELLQDDAIVRGKCKFMYPLLKEIPENVQTEQELLQNFLDLARPGESVVRYWKKIIILNNRRFWISNHIFKWNILPFKNLMSDLTGIDLSYFNPMQDNETDSTINYEIIYAEKIKKDMLTIFNQFQQGLISFETYLNEVKKISEVYSLNNYQQILSQYLPNNSSNNTDIEAKIKTNTKTETNTETEIETKTEVNNNLMNNSSIINEDESIQKNLINDINSIYSANNIISEKLVNDTNENSDTSSYTEEDIDENIDEDAEEYEHENVDEEDIDENDENEEDIDEYDENEEDIDEYNENEENEGESEENDETTINQININDLMKQSFGFI